MLVKLLMTEEVVTVPRSQTLAEAERLLIVNNLRRIPVVENSRVVGILSETDLLKAKPSLLDPADEEFELERFGQLLVEQVMTDNPVTVSVDSPVEEAAMKMRQHKINSIPVLREGLLAGIITETNIFTAFITLMGAEEDGVGIELAIRRGNVYLHNLLKIFSDQRMAIVAMSIYPEYSENHWLATLKTKGDNLDQLLDALRGQGVRVLRVDSHNNCC